MFVIERFGLSVRKAGKQIGLSRTRFLYKPAVSVDEEGIRRRLKKLAETRRRFGCRRLHVMLRREGFMINHKRTERIYRLEGLALRIRRWKKMSSQLRTGMAKPANPNHGFRIILW